jgi:hypothetical protein
MLYYVSYSVADSTDKVATPFFAPSIKQGAVVRFACTLTVFTLNGLVFFLWIKQVIYLDGRFLLEVEIFANTKKLLEEEITSLRKEVSKIEDVIT